MSEKMRLDETIDINAHQIGNNRFSNILNQICIEGTKIHIYLIISFLVKLMIKCIKQVRYSHV
jgi:hypothetical protein